MTTITSNQNYRLSFPRLVRSENIKISTLRSSWWSAIIVGVLTVAMSTVVSTAVAHSAPKTVDGLPFGLLVVIMPTTFTMLLATVIGAMQSSGEYSTGTIRSTTTASPRRVSNVFAKAVSVAAFVFIISIVSFSISALLTTPIMAENNMQMNWADPSRSWVPMLVGAVGLAVFALIGLACGYLLRSPAGAMAVAVGIVFVLPIIPSFFAATVIGEWMAEVSRYLPSNAFQTVLLQNNEYVLSSAIALAIWAIAPLALAAASVKSRDA